MLSRAKMIPTGPLSDRTLVEVVLEQFCSVGSDAVLGPPEYRIADGLREGAHSI